MFYQRIVPVDCERARFFVIIKLMYDLIGIIGGLLFLFGFYRTSIGKWTGKSIWYELDNLAGALLMSVYAFHKQAYISIFLNVVWALVAFKGVTAYAERRKKKIRRLFGTIFSKR